MKIKYRYSFLLFFVFIFSININGQKLVRIFPLPETKDKLPTVNLQFQFDDKPDLYFNIFKDNLRISGEKHGIYNGEIKSLLYNTIIFNPDTPFLQGDVISVKLDCEEFPEIKLDHSFMIRENSVSDIDQQLLKFYQEKYFPEVAINKKKKLQNQSADVPRLINGLAIPIDLPLLEPTINKETAEGNIFISNRLGPPYIMILENNGSPVFYRKVEDMSIDFKLQPTGVLSRRVRADISGFQSMDDNYITQHTYKSQGYTTDDHDIKLCSDGTAYLIGIDVRFTDMSQLIPGGLNNSGVIGTLIQQIDMDNNVLFEWNGWDHYDIIDAKHEALVATFVDFIHINSIDIDYDGNVLISSRHQSELTKINRKTGKVMWRLGGEHNMFEFVDSDQISYQHDFRPIKDKPNYYTIFDNGNFRSPQYTRVLEFRLDTAEMKLYKEWEYRPNPDLYSSWMGNAQRLPNGNTFICWSASSLPAVTEVTPAGEIVYEANFDFDTHSYRSFRFDWEGFQIVPEIIAEEYSDQLILIFNKFGDYDVKGFNLYTINSSDSSLIKSVEDNYVVFKDGDLTEGKIYNFIVKAYYADGSESESSEEYCTYFDIIKPGDNLIKNGNFYGNSLEWIINIDTSANATWSADSLEGFHFSIYDGGDDIQNIRLMQKNIPLIKGKEYIFEYDAVANSDIFLDAKIRHKAYQDKNYSKTSLVYVTSRKKHFEFQFIMEYSSDFESVLEFSCGGSNTELWIENVSLHEVLENGNIESSPDINEYSLKAFPNPVGEKLNLNFFVPIGKSYQIQFHDLKGRLIHSVLSISDAPEESNIIIDMHTFKEGVYLLSIRTQNGVIRKKICVAK